MAGRLPLGGPTCFPTDSSQPPPPPRRPPSPRDQSHDSVCSACAPCHRQDSQAVLHPPPRGAAELLPHRRGQTSVVASGAAVRVGRGPCSRSRSPVWALGARAGQGSHRTPSPPEKGLFPDQWGRGQRRLEAACEPRVDNSKHVTTRTPKIAPAQYRQPWEFVEKLFSWKRKGSRTA